MPAKKVLSASTPAKKPSLASLKSDKEVNNRARTKAVKKIESHVSKKSSTKKSPIVVKKKSDASGLGVKRSVKKKVSPSTEPVLKLPQNMSIRAREKALVLLEQVSKDFQKSAQQVAYVSGLCFMLLGASMALAFSGTFSSDSQQALLASSTPEIISGSTNQVVQITTPEVSLLDPLPIEAASITEHKLAVHNAKSVEVKVRSLQDGRIVKLSVDDLSPELYYFKIEPEQLSAGEHNLIARVESVFDGSLHTFNLGEFRVPYEETDDSSQSTSTTSGTSGSGSSGEEIEEEAVEEEVIEEVTTTATTTQTAPVITTNGPSLKVIAPGGDLAGQVLVKIEAPKDLPFIELYVRVPHSSNSRFVGLAEKRTDYWYFFFNTLNVPNGDYEIVARTRVSGKDYFSSGVKTRISNFATPKVVEAVEPMSEEEAASADTETPETTVGRSLPDFTLSDTNEQGSEETTAFVPSEVEETLSLYEEEIRELFNRYAVAQQSGDSLLIELARKELIAGKEEILNDILTDQSINYLADDAEKVLDERFAILEKRVSTFEELRRAASDSKTSVDTDKDGISDFDEQNLYNTNPEFPDTDNDGIQDGVEIMRGFDPLNPDAEAVIQYEMPQESLALVQEESLKVERIVPVIKNDDEAGKSVQAEITGKALPNSYVTLYIFSTPTIVSVRTDENGAFSYTFEKELEDGDHEVYVAITDNTGAIVARSNPFRFVKEAEAFTPLDGNAEQAITPESFSTIASFNSYNTVVGLGILAFGLILLMLGVSMREKAGVAPQEPSHDSAAS